MQRIKGKYQEEFNRISKSFPMNVQCKPYAHRLISVFGGTDEKKMSKIFSKR